MNNPIWIVKDVIARNDYTLLLTFANGEKRIYDAKPLLKKPIFKCFENINYFLQCKAKYGTVVWSEEIDIAPEHLYECSNLL